MPVGWQKGRMKGKQAGKERGIKGWNVSFSERRGPVPNKWLWMTHTLKRWWKIIRQYQNNTASVSDLLLSSILGWEHTKAPEGHFSETGKGLVVLQYREMWTCNVSECQEAKILKDTIYVNLRLHYESKQTSCRSSDVKWLNMSLHWMSGLHFHHKYSLQRLFSLGLVLAIKACA